MNRFDRPLARFGSVAACFGILFVLAACESDPDVIPSEEDRIVAARIDPVRIDRQDSSSQTTPDAREIESDDADEAARIAAMRAMLDLPTGSSSGPAGSPSGNGGESGGASASAAGSGVSNGTGAGSSDSNGTSDGEGGGEGASSSGGSGGGSSSGSGSTGTPAESGASSGSGTSGPGGDAAGGATGTGESAGIEGAAGATESGSGGAEGSGDSSGAPTSAGGAGEGAGTGDLGTVTARSDDYIEGVGGAQADAAGRGGGDPGFIEPEAMEGSGAPRTGGDGAAGAGSGTSAEDAEGGFGGGGGAGGGRREGSAPGGDDPPAIDPPSTSTTGTLELEGEPDASESGDDDAEDFLDAPVVLDLPERRSAPATEPSSISDSTDANENASSIESDSAAGDTPLDADSMSPFGLGDDAGDAALDGVVGRPGSEETQTPFTESVQGDSSGAPTEEEDAEVDDLSTDDRPLRERLAVPEVDVSPIATTLQLRDARSDDPPRDDPIWLLRGAWEQIDPDHNGPDFAPGGYRRNVIAIDPRGGVLEVYRVFRGGFMVAGAFRVEVLPEGTLLLGADDGLPHRFPTQRIELGGTAAVEPPIEPIELDRRWRFEDGVLEIEGRRFARIDRAAFERLAEGGRSASPDLRSGVDGMTAPVVSDDPPEGSSTSDAAGSVDFFGTSIVGRHICYVVDISGSMAGPRLEAALEELARSIRALPGDRSFYVLFFSGSKLVLEDRWQRATSSRKRAFTTRFADIEAQGGTEPSGALEHAFNSLAPVPDEIHFMTDGQIPGNIPTLLANLNGGRIRTVIHTYAFGDSAGAGVLKRIAADHGGTYRFIPDRP